MPDIRTILLGDDDPTIRRMAEVALRRDGFSVMGVNDGVEALQMLEDRLFDLVILDGFMPNLDGLEACRRIKADPRTAHIPVILLSARSHQSDGTDARQAGATAYITKPFDPLSLGRQIRAIWQQQSA